MSMHNKITDQNIKHSVNNRINAQQKSTSFFAPVIQPKLTINQPNDVFEQEADAAAEKIMRMPVTAGAKFFQPACSSVSAVQKKCAHCDEEEKNKIQRKETNDNNAEMIAPSIVYDVINSGGHGLDAETRNFMEAGFGVDFGNVQIHNDATAHRSSAAISALAYTHGNHVVFGEGQYQPNSYQGKKLLAHELAHVVQQSSGNISRKLIQRAPISYKQITWGDFIAKAPADPTIKNEGAEINTHFTNPIPMPSASYGTPKKTKTKCSAGKSKDFEYETPISVSYPDIDTFQAYMEPTLSWVGDRAKTNGLQYCKDQVVKCGQDIEGYTTQAKSICDKQVHACEDSYKGNPNNTFRYGTRSKTIVAYQKDQCSGTFLETCNAAYADEYKSSYAPGIKAKKDCTSIFLPKCNKDEITGSQYLLRHEQGHFDITKIVADAAREDLKSKFAAVPASVKGCGKADANSKAEQVINDLLSAVTTAADTWVKLRGKVQDDYDGQTVHSTDEAQQATWNKNIKAGLKGQYPALK